MQKSIHHGNRYLFLAVTLAALATYTAGAAALEVRSEQVNGSDIAALPQSVN